MIQKTCSKCLRVRPIEEFYPNRKAKDGRKAQCKPCGRVTARKYYHSHRERSLANSKERMKFQRNRDIANRRRTELRKQRPSRVLVEMARARARLRGLPFDLSGADVPVPPVCPVLGIPLVWGRGKRQKDDSPTLDRIIPELGYVASNVRVISWRANRLKSDATLDELRAVVAYYESALAVAVTAYAQNEAA